METKAEAHYKHKRGTRAPKGNRQSCTSSQLGFLFNNLSSVQVPNMKWARGLRRAPLKTQELSNEDQRKKEKHNKRKGQRKRKDGRGLVPCHANIKVEWGTQIPCLHGSAEKSRWATSWWKWASHLVGNFPACVWKAEPSQQGRACWESRVTLGKSPLLAMPLFPYL